MPTPYPPVPRLPVLLGATFVALTLAPAPSRAADLAAASPASVSPSADDQARLSPVWQAFHDWQLQIGAGAVVKPTYEGASAYEITPVPIVSAEFFGRVKIDAGGLGFKLLNEGPFRVDLTVGYDGGRDEDDDDRLRGMGDIDFGVTVGGKASYSIGAATLFVSLDQTIDGSEGLIARAGVAYTQPVTQSLILGARASIAFADDNYMQAYFGVDSGQSARSGHAAYSASAGLKSVDVAASATYRFDQHWHLRAEQSVGILTGDAADSPIVAETVQSKTMLMLGYRF